MRNKIFATAMSVVALAVLFLLPVGLDAIDTTKPQTSQTTTTTTYGEEATVVTTTAPQSEGEVTTVPTSDSGDDSVTTTVTVPAESETEKVTTTVAKDTEKPATTTVSTTKSTTTKKTTTVTTTKKSTTTTKKKTTTTMTTTKKTTTTTKKPADLSSIDAPAGSPVKQHGQLSVKGANIVDQNGKVFQLRGVSTHGVGWFPDAVSKNNFKVLRDDWGCNAVRLAMYIEESWGGSESCYLMDKQRNLNLVKNGIDYCIELGLYVIVDWHVLNPGDPSTHTTEAKEFFEMIANEYGDCPNIIYELCNEPNGGVTWSGKIKPYCESVLKSVRKYDSDNIVVCGTATWSQDIHDVVGKTINDKNVVYALHFYANTHTDWLRNRLKDCYNKGLPVLVTEFGTCDASGNGGFNASETKKWLNTLDSMNIGFFNWSLCNKSETASIMTSGSSLSGLKAGTSQLTESGKLIREEIRKRAGL
ncbi:MAG: glycoside hydrolase family 5 protein [Oscillospiraceae bacterium]|nr:glycoside hydrolase family 5 protein [Oscillospiraceae bacterium]MBQ8883125.1 glycoside hydrolase family 5 protein [Oscillospiraceae bacterium]